jgi:HEAT repeat protein
MHHGLLRSTKAAAALIRRLDDPNGYIRYLAVISLAETFEKNGEYAPNMDLFDRNPAFYIGLWKTWWTTDGQEFHPVSPS